LKDFDTLRSPALALCSLTSINEAGVAKRKEKTRNHVSAGRVGAGLRIGLEFKGTSIRRPDSRAYGLGLRYIVPTGPEV